MSKNPVVSKENLSLSIDDILSILPHRYPFLLVDKVQDLILGEGATGIKNVTFNEPFFQGHFPQNPIMPGVLIIEALAQTACLVVMKTLDLTSKDHSVFFMSIEEAKFRKPVGPGDQLKLKVQKQKKRGLIWKFKGEAYVDDELTAEAVYMAQIYPHTLEHAHSDAHEGHSALAHTRQEAHV